MGKYDTYNFDRKKAKTLLDKKTELFLTQIINYSNKRILGRRYMESIRKMLGRLRQVVTRFYLRLSLVCLMSLLI